MTGLWLWRMRFQGFLNTVKKRPAGYLFGLLLLGLMYWGMFSLTRRSVRFLMRYVENLNQDIAIAIMQRSLDTLFLILVLSVIFSVLTTAVHTLYSSEDLPFLLSLPIPPAQVFNLKVAETYVSAALMPVLFTIPILFGLGVERGAKAVYYPIALASAFLLYALPVAIGCLIALFLMRIAPAGRVKEITTALSVIFAAGFVFVLRFLRPERLADMNLAEMSRFLDRLANLDVGWLPTSWAAHAVWSAIAGEVNDGTLWLAVSAALTIIMVSYLAAIAYRQGWIRALDSGSPKLDGRIRLAAWWERPFFAFGQAGSIIVKDIRLLLRDPTQWSQLLVLLALAGVYLTSVGSMRVENLDVQRFRDALGTLNLVFMGFLLAGVGIRTAFPLVSLEGEGFWLLRTAPLRSSQIVLSKFWNSLGSMLVLGVGIGTAAAYMIDLSPTLAWISPLAGACAAIAITGLGIGLGAAYPRFQATSPSEIPLSFGGLMYMVMALAYSIFTTLILAWPAWRAINKPGIIVWLTPEGLFTLAMLLALTLFTTVFPLWYGTYKLSRYETGD